MASDMLSPQYRSRNHPKLPDLFERLHAQSWEPKTVDKIKDWLSESTTATRPPEPTHPLSEAQKPVPRTTQAISPLRPLHPSTIRPSCIQSSKPKPLSLLPLQPTYGNRAPLPPRTSRKRKMSENENPRQSARLKRKPPPESVNDGLQVKEKQSSPSARGRKIQKPRKESEAEGVEVDAFTSFKKTNGDGTHTLQQDILVEAAASYTPSRSSGSSPSKKSRSPSKLSRTLNRRERMQYLTPPILFETLIATKNKGHLTGRLRTLWLNHINWDDQEIIPTKFKEAMRKESDTPDKTKAPIPDHCFGASYSKYAEEDYGPMEVTIRDVLSMADKYRHSGCTEAHWVSVVINPLLSLVRRLRRYQKEGSKIAVVDLTTVDISPSSLCPTRADSLFKDLDKRIDAAIGLDLSDIKHEILTNGVYSEGTLPSINQTASFVNFLPMFTNIEVKKSNTDRDPLIQLGAWVAAEFNKRRMEGYSLNMPVLAIEIEGDAWNLHMVFALEDQGSGDFQCKFIGPVEMGSTRSILGIFQILDRLCRCVNWGIEEYQQWFDSEVLAKYGRV